MMMETMSSASQADDDDGNEDSFKQEWDNMVFPQPLAT
jgi:hypothetical protein